MVLPTYMGYISVTPDGRYFQDENGAGFIVIGQNDGTPWPGLVSLLGRKAPQETEDYILDLRAHGINVSRVMIEYAQATHTYFERKVGQFAAEIVQFWDDFIALAEKHGLYLLLTPFDTFWQARHWAKYPYNARNGGPCRDKHDFLTSPASIRAHKRRWEFIIRRWGGSPAIFAWDVMNEIDLWWNASPKEISSYISEIAPFIRNLEQQLYGRTHLLTCSSAAAVPRGELAEAIYNHPALDFANTHLYVDEGVRAPRNPVACAPEIAEAVAESLRLISARRPYFDSETGPITKWIKSTKVDKEYHHNLSWAHLASGAAGSGMRWPYSTPHYILPELRDNLLGLARFAAQIDWAHFDSRNVADKLDLNDSGVLKTACASDDLAILWLLRDTRNPLAPKLAGLRAELEGVLENGLYRVELWETYNGEKILEFEEEVVNGLLSFRLPLNLTLNDIAVLVRRI